MGGLDDYLRKNYGDGGKADEDGKKKKKKKSRKRSAGNFAVVDDEIVLEHGLRAKDGDALDDDRPVVVMPEEAAKAPVAQRKKSHSGSWVEVKSGDVPGKHDASPPRRRRDDDDASPPRRLRGDDDASPPRRRRDDDDASPPRRRRDDDDASPPRRRRDDEEASPPRRRRDDDDASPPRRRQDDDDASPPRRRRDDDDASPPRRRRDDDDASPPRRRRDDDDASPPRRRRDDDDASPPRKFANGDNDLRDKAPSFEVKANRKRPLMSSGLTAGLILKDDLTKQSAELAEQRKRMLSESRDEDIGRGAATVYRDEFGNKIVKRPRGKEEPPEDLKEKLIIDGEVRYIGADGLQDRNESDPVIVADAPTKTKADDTPSEQKQRTESRWGRQEQPSDASLRWGDPMANLIKVASKNVTVSKFTAPPNRFNIKPGPRWDGRDRSNGFESKFIEAEGRRREKEEKAYQWSVENM